MKKTRILSVFDFDGTLSYRDSFFLFLYFAFGKRYFIKRLIHMMIPAFYYISSQLTRDELKVFLIKTFLTNIDYKWLNLLADMFCKKKWTKIMRPKAILAVKKEINSGAEVTICSASPNIILKPFANRLGIKLISTQLEVKNGKLTGKIIGHNCRCSQKIIRLKKVYGDLENYHLRAWGNSRGDYELLAIAQESYWRCF